jgi:hypothetical protein
VSTVVSVVLMGVKGGCQAGERIGVGGGAGEFWVVAGLGRDGGVWWMVVGMRKG